MAGFPVSTQIIKGNSHIYLDLIVGNKPVQGGQASDIVQINLKSEKSNYLCQTKFRQIYPRDLCGGTSRTVYIRCDLDCG